MNKLNIFVSSTCYDLSQIRKDINEAIDLLGHTPILSEFLNFPINPSNSTIENCIEVVNSDADILLLIIGNRYGYIGESGKSITNLEFLAAKRKGIPIYIFIKKEILNILPVYLTNREGNYSNVVDRKEIFEFVNDLRNNLTWCYEFDTFQDIISILKSQLSHLFKESLKIRNKLIVTEDNDLIPSISSKALRIIIEKKELWEHEFFSQSMLDEMSKYDLLLKDYENKIVLRRNRQIRDNKDFIEWCQGRIPGIFALIETLNNLITNLFPKYLNEPGSPSDLKGLYYVANAYARTFESAINWAIETWGVAVENDQEDLKLALGELTSDAIDKMWKFPRSFSELISNTKIRIENGESDILVKLKLSISINGEALDRFKRALDKYSQMVKSRK